VILSFVKVLLAFSGLPRSAKDAGLAMTVFEFL